MNAKHLTLTLTLVLALGAGAAVAAIKYGQVEAPKAAAPAIPRVVVTATKAEAAAAQVTRIVIVGRRSDAGRSATRTN